MIQYIQLFFGVIIGQLLITTVMVYGYQKEKNITWGEALTVYVKAEIGYYVIAAVGLIAALFILSEFIDLSLKKEDLRSQTALSLKQKLQLYFKTGSLLLGMFIQYVVFKVKDKGKAAIDNAIK